MPMFDFFCGLCGDKFDALLRPNDHPLEVDGDTFINCRSCGGQWSAKKVWSSAPPSVNGDECDFVQENGLRHPRRFRSWSEWRRWTKEAHVTEVGHHVGVPGTDKSPITTDWSKGAIDAQTLANAEALVQYRGRGKNHTELEAEREADLDSAVEVGSVGAEIGGIKVRVERTYSGWLDSELLKRG